MDIALEVHLFWVRLIYNGIVLFILTRECILGIAAKSKYDGIPYTTLSYSTGGPNNVAYIVNNDGQAVRIDPSKSNTNDFTYSQQATIISDEASHGGGDVVVYAIGTSTTFRYYSTKL